MFQYSRLDVMFNRIRINEYTSVNDLESLLGITDRTIRNDIQEINNDLEKNGAIIKLKRNHGYYISILDEDKYNKFVKEMDTKEDNASLLDSSKTESNPFFIPYCPLTNMLQWMIWLNLYLFRRIL